jgi:hypothetical protein
MLVMETSRFKEMGTKLAEWAPLKKGLAAVHPQQGNSLRLSHSMTGRLGGRPGAVPNQEIWVTLPECS